MGPEHDTTYTLFESLIRKRDVEEPSLEDTIVATSSSVPSSSNSNQRQFKRPRLSNSSPPPAPAIITPITALSTSDHAYEEEHLDRDMIDTTIFNRTLEHAPRSPDPQIFEDFAHTAAELAVSLLF